MGQLQLQVQLPTQLAQQLRPDAAQSENKQVLVACLSLAGVVGMGIGIFAWLQRKRRRETESSSVPRQPPQPPDTLDPRIQAIVATEKLVAKLRERIALAKPQNDMADKYNILCIGQVSSGKSSFFNTANCAITDRFLEIAEVRGGVAASASFTREYRMRELKNIRLFDTMGFHDYFGITQEHVRKMLNGQIPDAYKFSGKEPIDREEQAANEIKMKNHVDEDKYRIHVVAFVLNGLDFATMEKENILFLKQANETCNKAGCTVLAIVTHLDKVSEKVAQNILDAKRSKRVQAIFKQIHDLIGINMMWMLPIVNYTNTRESDWHKNLLALEALDAFVARADGYFEDMAYRNNK